MKPIRSTREMLALCNIERARRTEPSTVLTKLDRQEQATFWRRPPLLLRWRESRR